MKSRAERAPIMAAPVEATPPGADERSFALSPLLVTLSANVNAAAESIRALRTHIMAQHLEKGRRALAICAATPGVGCTSLAGNLAVSLSQVGVKTLLIDANLRQPGIDRLFGPSSTGPGLEQCLNNPETNFGEYIEEDVLPSLSIMFAGGRPSNPQELLATTRFEDLMNFCLREYQITVLDTPPANLCSDARRVSTVAGYSVVVSRRNMTLVGDVRTLVSQLESERAHVVGTVLTED